MKKGFPPSHSLAEPKRRITTHATNDLYIDLGGIRLGFQQAMDGLRLETECAVSTEYITHLEQLGYPEVLIRLICLSNQQIQQQLLILFLTSV